MAERSRMSMVEQILNISGSLDIETVGLRSGAGIHEIAYGKFASGPAGTPGAVSQYIIEPESVFSVDDTGNIGRYQTGKTPFVYRPTGPKSRQKIDALNILLAESEASVSAPRLSISTVDSAVSNLIQSTSSEEFMSRLSRVNDFRANSYNSGKFLYLPRYDKSTKTIVERAVGALGTGLSTMQAAQAARIPVGSLATQVVSAKEVLSSSSPLSRNLRENVTWIANAQFESRQLGASLAVMEKELQEQFIAEGLDAKAAAERARAATFRNSLAWQNPRQTALLYTTGPEYNRARAAALMGTKKDGWIGVWDALLKNTKAGDVRDIFDVMKAQEAFVRKIAPGFLPEQSLTTGGIDVQYRLMRAVEEGSRGLLVTEAHIGALDVPAQEYITKNLLRQTVALQEAYEGTEIGLEYMQQAKAGRGPLSEVFARMNMTAAMMPDMQREHIIKRLDDAQRDLVRDNVTQQFVRHKLVGVKQINQAGEQAMVDVAQPIRKGYTNLDDVIELMGQQRNLYDPGILQEEAAAYRAATAGATGEELVERSRAYLNQRSLELTSPQAKMESFGRLAGLEGAGVEEGAEAFYRQYGQGVKPNRIFGRAKAPALPIQPSVVGRAGIAIAAGLALTGVISAVANGGRPKEPPPSMISANYQDWLHTQNEFYGTRGSGSYMNGMSHTGMAGAHRSMRTDFGSPYQGPIAANYVFYEQELLAEREKYMRQQFANIHAPSNQIIQLPKIGNQKYSFVEGGQSAQGLLLPGINTRVQSAKILDLNDYKIEVQDADTITVKRGGIRGALSSFFGFNRGYEFRLGGIDAPETFHGELGMKSAQPHADDATMALKAMLRESGSLQLVYDPENITYGRMVGAIIADGRNVNFDLVKRGHVAALPFYKKGVDPLVDLGAVEKLETFSRSGETGMWSNPFFQIYSTMEEASGKRITFNTFSRLGETAKSATTMSIYGLMQNAQHKGFVNTADLISASQLGERFKKNMSDDYTNMLSMPIAAAPHNSYLHEMAVDNANLIKTRGSSAVNKTSHRSGYGKLDKAMAIDSTGTTNSIWNKRKYSSYEVYGTEQNRRRRRRAEMAESQRYANRHMFQSPIGHHRM